MKALATDIESYFADVVGTRPWRARRGHGSFLTLDFGRRVRRNGHFYGEWHLWVYLSNWVLMHSARRIADSDSSHHLIDVAVRRLEEVALTSLEFDPAKLNTIFEFEGFRLEVSPADYLDDPEDRDSYWLFYMPKGEVLSVGPNGVRVSSSSE